MKKFLLVLGLLLAYTCVFSQYKGKKFIFDLFAQGKECDVVGGNPGALQTLPKGAVFTVESVTAAGDLVISFLRWKNDGDKLMYNYTQSIKAVPLAKGGTKNVDQYEPKFFLITKAVFDASCSEFQRGNITFGTMITPFKFRFKPSLFETNLNLGACVAFQFRAKFLSIGAIAGLSLSSVTLDEYSTDSIGLQGTDRPAVTPSIHLIGGYKNISLTVGFGWDLINKKSALEKKWLYNGRTWFGVGVGVNLFTANESKTTPVN